MRGCMLNVVMLWAGCRSECWTCWSRTLPEAEGSTLLELIDACCRMLVDRATCGAVALSPGLELNVAEG